MPTLIDSLLHPECYPHPVERVQLIETHISWLLLTGSYAYKIKKPVALGFVDFSTLARRKHFCEEELRLNRRLAPALYLDVVAITGSPAHPCIAGAGPAIEYAVRMRQFPQNDLLARMLADARLAPGHIDAIADAAADFHAGAAISPPSSAFASAESVLTPALDNFVAIERHLSGNGVHLRLATLKRWTLGEHARLAAVFGERQRGGFVRECHGDMHLGNMALVDGQPVIFDCIEFNEELRWIDVMSECAFVVMDLAARGHPALGWRFLNRYLESTGDYAGLEVLPFYLVYRAMVRAKVDALQACGADMPAPRAAEQWQDFLARLALAQHYAERTPGLLAITCGPSGTGKTYATQVVLERLGAIRLRSDVERKRIFGLRARDTSESGAGAGIYSAQANERTFERLAALARTVLAAGQNVLIDATFLTRARRAQFAALAAAAGAPFAIILCRAPGDVALTRIDARRRAGLDASEADRAIYGRQLAMIEQLTADEQGKSIEVDTARAQSLQGLVDTLAALRPR